MAVPSPKSTVMLVVELRPFGQEREEQSPWLQGLNHISKGVRALRYHYCVDFRKFQLSGHELGTYNEKLHAGGPCPRIKPAAQLPSALLLQKKIKQVHNILEGLIKKACSQKARLCAAALYVEVVSTSSRKTRKVTFLPRVATSVPSLVRSWRPLGARLGHFWRLGLNLRGAPSVQLFDKALRYLEISRKKGNDGGQ